MNQDDQDNSTDNTASAREDKIFNNSYYNGDKLKDSEEYEFSKKISVSSDYSDTYLKDLYDYEEQLESKFILDIIFEFLQKDEVLSKYLENISTSKIKFSKEDINIIFNRTHDVLDVTSHGISFYSPIYVLEAISSILNINSGDPVKDYRKIFDCLEVEIQEELILELNKKYNFLDNKINKKRIH